eukprot:4820092-Alexandrium_andersonii.AAC.1
MHAGCDQHRAHWRAAVSSWCPCAFGNPRLGKLPRMGHRGLAVPPSRRASTFTARTAKQCKGLTGSRAQMRMLGRAGL